VTDKQYAQLLLAASPSAIIICYIRFLNDSNHQYQSRPSSHWQTLHICYQNMELKVFRLKTQCKTESLSWKKNAAVLGNDSRK